MVETLDLLTAYNTLQEIRELKTEPSAPGVYNVNSK